MGNTIPKNTNIHTTNSEGETTEQRQFWKGSIRNSIILNVEHLKQNSSEKDKAEKVEH